MKTLQVKQAKSSYLHPAFDNIQTFELDEKPFDWGAFGAVYFCHSANGKPLPVPQVVKILVDDGSGSAKQGIRTIQNLQDKIVSHNAFLKSSNQKTIEQINCMFALPQVSYEGTFNGKVVYGYAQNRLNTKEFTLFREFFDEPDPIKKKQLREKYNKTSVADRLQLACDLVEGFQVLRDMAYIHADLNPKNLFIRLNPPALTLIDYDSGVVVNDPTDEADTFGQLGGWIAPEIQAQLMKSQQGRIKVDLNTDTWAVMVAIHYLIFLFHPLDFLKIRGEKNMKTYFAKSRWAEFDTKDPNFRQELASLYPKYKQMLQNNIPPAVLKAFDVTINQGYFNRNQRVTYRQWLRVLVEKPPAVQAKKAAIISFFCQKSQVTAGETVTLTWQIKDAYKVVLNGKNLVGAEMTKGSSTVQPYSDTAYVLEATGTDGQTVRESLVIKVTSKTPNPVTTSSTRITTPPLFIGVMTPPLSA
ncbi:MAG: serine/threonine protein kinase [Verrucomicrobia bacterium]|nr:serine/threonine protein kinase [Cytophagales bacterium]